MKRKDERNENGISVMVTNGFNNVTWRPRVTTFTTNSNDSV